MPINADIIPNKCFDLIKTPQIVLDKLSIDFATACNPAKMMVADLSSGLKAQTDATRKITVKSFVVKLFFITRTRPAMLFINMKVK